MQDGSVFRGQEEKSGRSCASFKAHRGKSASTKAISAKVLAVTINGVELEPEDPSEKVTTLETGPPKVDTPKP
jgi:hypothetical protein